MQKIILVSCLTLLIGGCSTNAEYPMSSRKIDKNLYELKIIGNPNTKLEEMESQMKEHANQICSGAFVKRNAKTQTAISTDQMAKSKKGEARVYTLTTIVECLPKVE